MNCFIFLSLLIFSHSAFCEFKNQSELTTIVNGGNTEQETWYSKTLNTLILKNQKFILSGHYTYGKASEELSARNWDINFRYERIVSKKWSSFSSIQREADLFASLDYRWNYDVGGVYRILDSKKIKLISEMGYRRTLESDLDGRKDNASKLRLYTHLTKEIKEKLEIKFWLEYLPNLSLSNDWQINFSPSLHIGLTDILFLKVGYLHKYDNQPLQDTKKSDYQYTTSFIGNL